MGKRNNQKMIRMSIESSILRFYLRKKNGFGNNALIKAVTLNCSLLGMTLKKQGMKTQNTESDPRSQVILSISVCIQGVHKRDCYFSSFSEFS